MQVTLLDFEAVADPAAAGGAAGADPGAGQGDPAAALPGQPAEGSAADPAAPAASGWSPDDPDFQQFLADRDAQLLARARELSSPQPQQQAPQGPGVDLNDFLNPLNENYGENMARFLADRDQHMISQMRELFAPVLSDREQAEIQRGSERMDTLIATEHWNEQRDGKLTDQAKAAIKDLAPQYMDEFTRLYGETPVAAERALAKAAATIRGLNASAHNAGGAANIDQLNAVGRAPGEPAGGGGAIDVPQPAKSPRDVFARHFGPGAGVTR